MSNQVEVQDRHYSPFILQGIEIYTPDHLVKLCEVPSTNASEYLMRGDFENWFDYIGKKDLAQIASESRNYKGNNEECLSKFISSYKLLVKELPYNSECVSEELVASQNDNLRTNEELDKQLKIISENIQKYRNKLPEQRPPTILICGKTGNGKSTSINTLFGKDISSIGHFSRGTSKDEVYEWQAYSENINIVDLPGLGDSPRNDKIFEEIYCRRVKEADGYIILICPPRPAEEGTLKTVRLLIENGVSSKHIIFGYNKLSYLMYSDNGNLKQVELKGLIGPTSPSHIQAIESAKKAFLEDIRKAIPNASFDKNQIIEFDSISGWNLHKMLFAVVEILPFEALAKLKKVTDKAQEAIEKKEKKQIRKEKELIDEEKKLLKQLEIIHDAKIDIEQKKRELRDQIEKKEKELQERKEAVKKFEEEKSKFAKTMVGKVAVGIGKVVSRVNPKAGETIIKAGMTVQKAAKKTVTNVANNVRKTVNKVEKWFKSWF